MESVNDTIRNIKEFNTDHALIFEKEIQFWKDKSEHLFIDGFIFENSKVKYEYHATEDLLRLIRYEYDSITGLKEQFVKHTDEKPVNNGLLHSIENREQLIALIEPIIPKNSELINTRDPNHTHELIKKGRSEIYTRYKDNEEIVRIAKRFDKRGNLVYIEERNTYQTITTKLKYNRKNQLVLETFCFDDYQSKTSYQYNNDVLAKTITKHTSGSVTSTDYFYLDGVLMKEVIHKPEGTKTLEYSYEYFDE